MLRQAIPKGNCQNRGHGGPWRTSQTTDNPPPPEAHSGRWCQKSVSWVSFWLFVLKVSLGDKHTDGQLERYCLRRQAKGRMVERPGPQPRTLGVGAHPEQQNLRTGQKHRG